MNWSTYKLWVKARIKATVMQVDKVRLLVVVLVQTALRFFSLRLAMRQRKVRAFSTHSDGCAEAKSCSVVGNRRDGEFSAHIH